MGEISLDLELDIYKVDNTYSDIIGVGNSLVSGFKFDLIRLLDSSDQYVSYNTFVSGDEFIVKDGTSLSDWSSGVLSSLTFSDLDIFSVRDSLIINPVYSTGEYRFYWDNRILYSDYSVTGILKNNQLDLLDDYKSGTLTLSTYYRDENGRIFTCCKHDYEVSDLTLLTQLYTKTIGTADYYDTYHNANDYATGASIYLHYFPVDKDSVKVFYFDNENTVYLTQVDDINFCLDDNFYYSIDEDYGIVHLSGREYEDLILEEFLAEEPLTNIIKVFPSIDFDNYPDSGVLKIGSEKIKYKAKGRYAFLMCTRGQAGTTIITHDVGDVLIKSCNGLTPNRELYISYSTAPRFQYEVSNHELRSATNFDYVSVSPKHNVKTSKIVQITSSIPILDELVLEADKALIATDYYGPAYFGTDVTKLTVTATDASNNPIDNLEVTIYMLQGNGNFENIEQEIEKETNTDGEAYAFYNSSLSDGTSYLTVQRMTHTDGGTEMYVPGLYGAADAKDIFVYQILKHDGAIGTNGVGISLYSSGTSTEEWGLGFFDTLLTDAEKYVGGILKVLISGVWYTFTITHTLNYDDGTTIYQRLYVDSYVTSFVGIVRGMILAEDDIVWNGQLLNGVPVIVYTWSDTAIHPLTNASGAYTPITASSISNDYLYFSDLLLPLPEPDNDGRNLGGYKVIAPQLVKFQAMARDPFSGKLVKSNIISLLVKLPSYLTGVSYSDALPIPHGFRIATEDFNAGSSLGPANFLTINPQTSGFNQLNIYGDV